MADRRHIRFTHGGRGGGGFSGEQIEGSGTRHAISRRLNASVRRESGRLGNTAEPFDHQQQYGYAGNWSGEQQPERSIPMYSSGGVPSPSSDDEDDEASQASRDQEYNPRYYHTVQRGQTGRFFSSSQTSHPSTSTAEAWVVQEAMPGGPEDGTVIPSFGGHVAAYIWGGQERNVLRCLGRTQLCSELVAWRGRLAQEHLELIDSSGLSHLPGIMFRRLDWPLISAFVERWQPDTNTFHMPFGEITVMLHDVYYILGLRVDGSMVSATPSTDTLRDACSITMDLTAEELNEKSGTKTIWQGSGVLTERIAESTLESQRPFNVHYSAYLWLVLGGCLFLDKSGNRTHPSFLSELVVDDLPIDEYSWGSAVLAYLYRHLGTASRKDADSIAGCLTLLQAWIYEYFSCFRPQQGTLTRELSVPRASAWDVGSGCPNKSMERLLAFRSRLDQLTDNEVNWLPYGIDPARRVPATLFIGCIQYRGIIEPYMPDRVVRQLGFVLDIPGTIIRPEKAKRPTNLKMYRVEFPTEMTSVMWTRFVPGSSFSVVPGALTRLGGGAPTVGPGYMQWLYRFSHPRISPVGSSVGDRLLERTNTDYWMGRSLEIHRRALAEYPSMSPDTRGMTEQLILDWQARMGL
ncbi:protein MAIN-LIKE 1-like [Chenopodium quinoa]|uniref:protein MAIN-LIKE 1-like n=1 Tax=Chenopodium quinoa TaxID=63459 RepID=UPI000B79114E|nr:protein MAIN-LIKE 1-like [Chenopodium quinoa]